MRFLRRIIVRGQRGRGRHDEMAFCGQVKQTTDVVLRITNGGSAFPLSAKIVLDNLRERWEWLLVVLRQAVLRISAREASCQDSDSRLDIFAGIRGQRGGELVIELCERHNGVSIQNFFSVYKHQMSTII